MMNYLVWYNHREVQLAESDDENEDQMDDMIPDIDIEYNRGSGEQHPPLEVQNFYKLHVASDEKVQDGTDVTVLQVVTCLLVIKSIYSFSNECYSDIIKLIIDLIPTKHNMPKDLFQYKKIVAGLGMSYEKIDVREKNCMLFWKEHKDNTECMHCGRCRYMKVIN
jgi:hypothetical protein